MKKFILLYPLGVCCMQSPELVVTNEQVEIQIEQLALALEELRRGPLIIERGTNVPSRRTVFRKEKCPPLIIPSSLKSEIISSSPTTSGSESDISSRNTLSVPITPAPTPRRKISRIPKIVQKDSSIHEEIS